MPEHKMAVVDGVRYRPEDTPAAASTAASADQQPSTGTDRTSAGQTRRRRSPARQQAGTEETSE